MAKRVKKGFNELLHGHIRAYEEDGFLALSLSDIVRLSVEACQALGMTAVLEDVPEPWERVAEAIREATKRHQGRDWTLSAIECRHIAEALGIEPEGE